MLLDNVDFELSSGELVVLLGPNGAGKTSLLNVLNGQLSADSGRVTLLGKNIADWSLGDKARHQASLAQQSPLNFPYRARDVVALGRAPHRSGHAHDRVCVEQAMAAMDVQHLASHIYTQLSGGEKQRVQLARVFVQLWPLLAKNETATDATFLLLDEPTAALDLAHQQLVLEACVEQAKNQGAALLVLHDINLALRFAHRLVLMAGGKIIADGTPAEIAEPALLKQVFGIDAHIIQHPLHGCPHVVF